MRFLWPPRWVKRPQSCFCSPIAMTARSFIWSYFPFEDLQQLCLCFLLSVPLHQIGYLNIGTLFTALSRSSTLPSIHWTNAYSILSWSSWTKFPMSFPPVSVKCMNLIWIIKLQLKFSFQFFNLLLLLIFLPNMDVS